MTRAFSRRAALSLALASLMFSPAAVVTRAQNAQPAGPGKEKQDEPQNRSKSTKTHFARANQAMQQAQAIRQQLQSASNEQKPPLLDEMKRLYQTAIDEYQQTLQDTEVREANGVQVIGLLHVIRNGLVSQEKAVQMLVQDPDLPVILSNLGMAYTGTGQYPEAINVLQQAAILKPAAKTYMELGTDLAEVGKLPDATAACDKVLSVDPAAKELQAGCYTNIAIVLTNQGRVADAVAPLRKATQINPQDALAWKLLGDALMNSIGSKSENGQIVYVVPEGTKEAYQKYLELEPRGHYAGQVQAALEGLASLSRSASPPEAKPRN
jgi:tetratricopeptide (TPR) repeat protein